MDAVRFLSSSLRSVSLDDVMAIPLPAARGAFAEIRGAHGLSRRAAPLLTEPDGNIKLSHSGSQKVAAYGLNLLPSDSSGDWRPSFATVLDGTVSQDVYFRICGSFNTCRFASPGCRAACLATSGQAGMEKRSGGNRIYRARRAKLAFLMANPAAFLRILIHEIDALKVSKWETAGFTVSLRLNVLSDIPWETVAPFLLARATDRGIRAYDYTAWPNAKRSRRTADAVGLYLVDSVKETHSDAQIRAMARPVVVVNIPRGRALPETFRGRPAHDADVSDARFLDPAGSVSLLRYKHVATCTASEAIASGFVKSAN